MDVELRPITPDQVPAFIRAVSAAFGHLPPDSEIEQWRSITETERAFAAFDGSEIVGTAEAWTLQLTLPGGRLVPAAGVTSVGVRSTHRRRGLLRRMMAHQLDDVAERGEPIAVLTASESVIYGRFGYGLAASAWDWVLPTEGTRLQTPAKDAGRIHQLDGPEAVKVVPGIFERACRRHPGAVSRPAGWWSLWADGNEDPEVQDATERARFQVVHESAAGEPDGYASWRVREGKHDSGLPAGELHVQDLYGIDDDVEAALWEHLLSVDLFRSIHAQDRPVEDPLRWRLADPRRLHVRKHADHLWLRIVDPATAFSSRTYNVEGRLTIRLDDPFRPSNSGTWRIEGGPDGAECRRTTAEPELATGAGELGALLLGGVSATTLRRAGRVDELADGALQRADALLASSMTPWCGTAF